MKIIDLLNKIANGEEVPKKIIWNKLVYNYKDGLYYDYCGETLIGSLNFDGTNLHDEIEILEEEKKIPEKLDNLIGYDIQQFDDLKEYVEITTNDLFGKINKIIDTLNQLSDYLKSKGDE